MLAHECCKLKNLNMNDGAQTRRSTCMLKNVYARVQARRSTGMLEPDTSEHQNRDAPEHGTRASRERLTYNTRKSQCSIVQYAGMCR